MGSESQELATIAEGLVSKVIDPAFFAGIAGAFRLRFTDRDAALDFRVVDGAIEVAPSSSPPGLTVDIGWEALERLTTGQLDLHDLLRYGYQGKRIDVDGDPAMVQALMESLRASLPSSKVNLTDVEMSRIRSATASVRPTLEIDRRGDLTPEEFMETYALPGRPVVLTEMTKPWKIHGATLDDLRTWIGDVRTKAYFYNDNTQYELPIAEYIDALESGRSAGAEGALQYAQMELPGEVARRLQLMPPPYFEKKHYVLPRMWLGPRGATTPIHYDDIDNFLAQVIGEKTVTLYHPDEADLIDPEGKRHLFAFDPQAIDRRAFPLARHANPIRFVLRPGEVLFNPGMWYHHVTVSRGPSFSINFFVGRALPAVLWKR